MSQSDQLKDLAVRSVIRGVDSLRMNGAIGVVSTSDGISTFSLELEAAK
jgi:hypothetical protein